MKKFLLLATSALLLLAGCAKEMSGPKEEGGLQEVTFTANLAGETTKASADNDGNAASVNRCIMEIYYGDDLFTRMYSTVDANKKAEFKTQLVANRTYTVAFWADCVTDASSAEGLAADLYYTTTSLKAVAIKGDYVGNNDARDAFFHCDSYTVAQTGSIWSDVKLYRPFSQINVITTDLQTIKPVPALVPTGVNVTVKNAYTTFNVVDGTLGGIQTLNYAASLYNFPETIGEKTEATLSMDYLFAATDKAVIDIDWKATKANNADVSHAFANIPYQRNYRTNIKGALLTTQGQWNVTVEPTWNVDQTGEFDVIVLIANTIEDAQTLINANAGDNSVSKTVEIQVKEEISTVKELYIPDNTTTPNWVFKIEDMTAQGQIVVRDQNPNDESVNYKRSAEVALPSGTTASQTTFNTPNAHGVVSGDFGRIDATTSATTLEVKADATVDAIYVHQGNIALYGTVDHIYRAEGNTATVTVNIYDGAVWTNWDDEKDSEGITPIVNLGTYTFDPTGYNVAGSAVTDNGNQTWTVAVINDWEYYAAESFSNVSGTTITIMNAAELALLSKEYNSYKDYNLILGCDIDLSGHNWNPISTFSGEFDGNGRTVSKMTVNGADHQGLFAALNGANVHDLTISNAEVTGTKDSKGYANCGVLAGAISSGSINNVTILNSEVDGEGEYVGALCGSGYSAIDGCTISGCTVTGKEQVGGAMGYMWVGYIQNCTVTGNTVHATSQRAGGLVGKVQFASGNMGSSTMWIKNNTVSGTITAETENTVGGIAGQIMGNCDKYEISGNSIDATCSNCPIGTLRASQEVAFTSVLAAKIHDNTWTEQTFAGDSYTYPASLTGAGDQIIWNGSTPDPVAKIDETEYLTLDAALKAGIANNDGVPVKIIKDITYKPSATWTPVPIGFYLDTRTLVVDGGNHTITNLPEMMFDGDAGCFNLTIKDLTFEKPTATDNSNAAVICGDCTTSGSLTFSNVKINNANVTSGDYAGAFIGYNSTHGDGGAVTFENCSVTNSTITGVGSTGALMGHATGNSMGKVTVTGTTVTGNTISCTESGKTNKAGSLFGTVGFATENVYVSATVSGNTVTSDGTTITTIYGRKGTDGGNLYLTEGGSYADKPIADADASWAMCDDGCVLKQVDNVWTVAKIDGVACVGGIYYKTLDAACSAVTADAPMTWVSSSIWAADKVAYYEGTFYATLSAALDAANTANSAETALIYIRPNQAGIAVSQSQYGGHDQIKTSITIFGNNAHLASQWQPCVDYTSESYDAGGHILTKDITYSIYNLHDGASAWGARGSEYTLNVIAKHCTNMSQVYVSVGTKNGQTNFTVEDCTFKYVSKEDGNRGYVCPITTNQKGLITVKNCTFTDFDDNYVFNINNKKGDAITVYAENLTFDNCGSSSKQGLRLMGEADGTTLNATLKNITFTNNSGKIGDIVLGKKDANENKCAVSYSISGTSGKMQVYKQNTADETVITLDSAQNYSGDNK